MSQSDLEKVLATSKKTKVAASEYSGLTGWTGNMESGDYQLQAAIGELSKLVASQIFNIQPDRQDS